jgi:hypothetical protein
LYEFFYSRGSLPVDQLQDEIARFWSEAKTNPDLQAKISAAGFPSGALDEIDKSAITLRVGSSGTDPASVILIVALAPTANRALKDVWSTVLLPRIRRRWGDDAVGDEIRRDDK